MEFELILHAGMGKTGTTSLQRALAAAEAAGNGEGGLSAQKAHYLGMWFDRLGEDYARYPGLMALAKADAETQRSLAERFADSLAESAAADGTRTFVLSNESLFERGRVLAPFLGRLAEAAPVKAVVYLRPPRDWLPSAFAQWGVYHKTQNGPVPEFADLAPRLLRHYRAITLWHDIFGDRLAARLFGRDIDIVADFAAVAGITLCGSEVRHQARPDPVEMLLRGLFNDRFGGPVLPGRFNAAVLEGARLPAPRAAAMAARIAATDGIEAMIAAEAETFAFIETVLGLDMTGGAAADGVAAGSAVPAGEGEGAGAERASAGRDGADRDSAERESAGRESAGRESAGEPVLDPALQARLIDALTELTLAQATRIARLETAVAALEAAAAPKDGGKSANEGKEPA